MKHFLVSVFALILFTGCDSVGDDGPRTAEECPLEAVGWTAASGSPMPNDDDYDQVYASLKNVADHPIQIQDGRLTYTLHGEDEGSDVTYSVLICCSTTDGKVQPGDVTNTYDIWPHVELLAGGKGAIFDHEAYFPSDGAYRQKNISISANDTPCKVFD